MVDISQGGFSVAGDLRKKTKEKDYRKFTLAIGFIEFEVSAEFVYFGADMTNFKIKGFSFNEKSDFHKFLEYMQIGYQEDHGSNKSRLNIADDSWQIKTNKIAVTCSPEGLKFTSKPFFKTKNLAALCILGFIAGLNRKQFPVEQLSADLINAV